MATGVKLMLVAFLVYCIFRGGNEVSSCDPFEDIIISQFPTHRMVRGKPQWLVNVTNDCICTEFGITLKCDGFQTVEELDPKMVTVSGGICTLDPTDQLRALGQNENITFTYAWDTQFPFKLNDSTIGCS